MTKDEQIEALEEEILQLKETIEILRYGKEIEDFEQNFNQELNNETLNKICHDHHPVQKA